MGAVLKPLAATLVFSLLASTVAAERPRILYLNDQDPRTPASLEKLRRAVAAAPWFTRHPVEVELVTVDFDDPALDRRIAEAIDRTPGIAAVVAPNGVSAVAARKATTSVPVVFGMHQDPVALHVVRSLSLPGGNLTGFTLHSPIGMKRMELLLELKPGMRRVGVVHDRWWHRDPEFRDFDARARALGVLPEYFEAQTAQELEALLASRAHAHVEGWYIYSGPMYQDPARGVAAINALCRPAVFDMGMLAPHGALLTYQPSLPDPNGLWAKLLGRVMEGTSPAVIPVEGPRDFDLQVNLRTARACGIAIPPGLLRRATKVHGP